MHKKMIVIFFEGITQHLPGRTEGKLSRLKSEWQRYKLNVDFLPVTGGHEYNLKFAGEHTIILPNEAGTLSANVTYKICL